MMCNWLALFRKKKFEEGSGSLSSQAWHRLTRNRLAMTAMGFIILCILIAILGYIITPDKTPFANYQALEISMQKPGFSADFVKIKKNEEFSQKSWLSVMISGRRSKFTLIPFTDYDFIGDRIIIREYTDEGDPDPPVRDYLLADVVFPLDEGTYSYDTANLRVTFKNVEGNAFTIQTKLLQEMVKAEHLVTRHFWLGTDRFGRDMFSRLLIGTRISLSVGFISVTISLIIGLLIGSLGGYFRGWVDQLVMWLINVVWSIPTLLLVIAITFALGKGFWQIFIAVGMTTWVEIARVSRGQIISIREKEYVEAARALGYNDFRIITRHILPNIMGPVIVIMAANFASAILIEAGLSFLGIGVQPPIPSWGTMIRENYSYIILDAAYLAIIPGLAIMMLVLAFMILGNGLRDALDVRIK